MFVSCVSPVSLSPQTLASLTPEAFSSNVRAVVESLLEKDKNLNQETSRHWGEIAFRNYVFDRSAKEAAAVGALTLAGLVEFYDRHFSLGGAGRRKIAAWVHGNQYPIDGGDAVAGGGEGEGADADGGAGGGADAPAEEEGGGGGRGETQGGADAAAEKEEEGGDGGGGGGRFVREVVIVEDYSEFKRSMPLLPLTKPTRVVTVEPEQSKL